MKKSALILSTALLASTANADVLGVTAEAGSYLINDGDDFNSYFGIALEHPIPLIPNLRIQHQSLESKDSNNSYDLPFNDYTLYYELLDGLTLVHLDVGATFRKIDHDNSDIGGTYPLLYASAFLDIPGTVLSVGAEVKTGGNSDADITDTTFKVKFQPLVFAGLELGYRTIKEDFKSNGKVEPKGLFIGAFVDF
ncbi:TIGR04219 family outer membrane beta-barrel protein [Marinomonas sp. FW-1]|uniref:TIGR04219 family outer membrane beta-barrel protein n=1 Tax=Marinomonas sp. FW-1 TaxID=2071621 RepID=UPI0010BFD051|nr:TIGR04219 family outer membrane beta-barrel protein [Marinomonas sp. FW-1]